MASNLGRRLVAFIGNTRPKLAVSGLEPDSSTTRSLSNAVSRFMSSTTQKEDQAILKKETEEVKEGSEAEAKAGQNEENDGEYVKKETGEIGGPKGPEPTRYGDWEKGGRCYDF